MEKFRIAHLYGNLLNTYGDNGNLLLLKYFAKLQGNFVESEIISLQDDFTASDYDLVFIGGGQDLEQSVVARDLQMKKKELEKYIENDGVLLAICGGYQLLGHYYITADGEKIEGTGLLDLYTERQENGRFIGDIVIHNEEFDETYVGFENHNGVTHIGQALKPLGIVQTGNGNNGFDQTEGVHYKNVFCSYLHGPLLVRNQHLAKRIIDTALTVKEHKRTKF